MTIGSIFAHALRTALNGQERVFDYGDQDTFVGLWTSGESRCPEAFGEGDELAARKPIVIVWDGRALSAPDKGCQLLEPHLTPMDWALAFSINALAQDEAPWCAGVSIHIVDLTGRDHASWSMRMRHQLLAEMPWVTLHAPLIPNAAYRKGYAPILDGPNALLIQDGGCQEAAWALRPNKCATLKDFSSRGYGTDLNNLTRQWASTLVHSHDHHDLNNAVVPRILSENTDSLGPSEKAFRTKLSWTGVMPDVKGARESAFRDWTCSPLNVLVIDDQLSGGWEEEIRVLFSVEQSEPGPVEPAAIRRLGCQRDEDDNERISMYGAEAPSVLARSLGLHGPGDTETAICTQIYTGRRYDSPLSGHREEPWLLVLDLLMFSGQLENAKSWYGKLYEIAHAISCSEPKKLAWRGFDENELAQMDLWLSGSGGQDEAAYDLVLSLLPRLCALRWPSVPIVLFSATTRRRLFERLTGYDNILYAPPKPSVFSGSTKEEQHEQISAFYIGWNRTLHGANHWVNIQKRLLRLQKVEICNNEENQDGLTHLTIAFDESAPYDNAVGDLAIGGVIVEVKTAKSNSSGSLGETRNFFEELRQNGVNFYDHVPAYTEYRQLTGSLGYGRFIGTCAQKGTDITVVSPDVV